MAMENGIIENILTISSQCFSAKDQKKILNDLSAREASVVISLVQAEEKVSGNDLATRNKLSPSRMSRIVESLVEKGYLVREYSETDRRYIELSLSQKGKDQRNEILSFNKECENALRDRLSSSDLSIVENAMEILIHAMEKDK